jgi:hypothetical protein
MNFWFVGVLVYGLLLLVGAGLSFLISMLKCSKISAGVSFQEGAVWSVLPTLLYVLTKWSPYVLHIFSEPIRSFSPSMSLESSELIGTGYLMMLGSWIMTTRMIHTTESEVCKPSKDELAKFRDDLEKELKEKEDEKQANLKPTA